jgi:hypothetical protein
MGLWLKLRWAMLSLGMVCCLVSCSAASLAQGPAPGPDAPQAKGNASLSGVVKDVGGTPVGEATVALTGPGGTQLQAESDDEGNFRLDGVPAGTFTLTVSADGLTTQTLPVTLGSQEQKVLPPFMLRIATAKFQVDAISQKELADQQLKVEEQQRILAVFPNFYVAYDPNTVPLTQTQKLKLAWRSVIDPEVFIGTAFGAGINQATQTPVEWNQNFTGFMQRYGAAYAGAVVATGLEGVVFPAVFHQDPRYFKGTGTKKARFKWAMMQVVAQRDDKGKWVPAYSNTLGGLAASAATVALYPHQSTKWGPTIGAQLGLNFAGEAFGNLMVEFVVPHLPTFKKKTAPAP